jgi:hypothetical protein
MAIPIAAGAARLLWTMTKGALRQTKRLSPFKRSKPKIREGIFKKGGYTGKTIKGPSFVGGKELRPWAQSIVGKEGVIAKFGGGAKKTKKLRGIATHQYARGYKHLRKHKKLYGAGLGGAAIWDILDND